MPPTDPQSFAPPLLAAGAMTGAPLYVTGEDALACTVYNAAAGVTVTITGRVLELGDVRPKPFAQTITPATDRSASVVRFSIGDGWLLSVQAVVTGGTPATGQTFARLSLVRGTTSNALEQFTLAANYVTAKMPVSYPGSPVLGSTEGAGALRSITGATPAAGAEVSETVPTGARWQLVALRATLTTSATVASRNPALLLDDGTNVFSTMSSISPLAASLNSPFGWAIGAQLSVLATNGSPTSALPSPHFLGAGYRFRTSTAAIQAADQWSAIQYLVREWIEGA